MLGVFERQNVNIVVPLVLGSLIVIAMVVLYQTYQGLFSSFIMLVLTGISAAIAWNYCEPVGFSIDQWRPEFLNFMMLFGGLIVLGGSARGIMRTPRYARLVIGIGAVAFLMVVGPRAQMPVGQATGNSYGQALALVGLFSLSLVCLRAIADHVIVGNVTFPWQIERVGGAILGFFTGMIIAGMALIGWQLLAFGPGLLASNYQNFYGLTALAEKLPENATASSRRQKEQIKLQVSGLPEQSWASYDRYDAKMKLQAAPFPYVDTFTLNLVKALSKGSMSGKQLFGQVHQDLLLEAWGNRNGINLLSRQAAGGKAISSAQWQLSDEPSPEANSDNRLRGVLSLTLTSEAEDEDGQVVRFKGSQVRLVGQSGRSYWPRGIHLDNIAWSKLYGALSVLALPGKNGELGYLDYNKADYRLWAKDDEDENGVIRREIRGTEANKLWWQVQLLGRNGELELLPASFGVVWKLPGKKEMVPLKLIFEIDEKDEPDYVVFKRTAMRKVQTIKTVEKDSTKSPGIN